MNYPQANIHFIVVGEAQKNLGDSVIPIPSSPPGAQYVPAVGDLVTLKGLESFTLGVVLREFKFLEDALEINCYLDTVSRDSPVPGLRRVK